MRLILVSAVCMISMVSWGQTSILGNVEDGQGKAVAGIHVGLYPRPPLTVTAGTPRTQTGADGTFRFDGLTPGPYRICAGSAELDYPDTCAWDAAGMQGSTVTAVAGQRVTAAAIRVAKGVRLRVNFTDPAGLLERDEPRPQTRLLVKMAVPPKQQPAQRSSARRGNPLLLVQLGGRAGPVRAGMGFTFLPMVEKGGARRGYEMLVPRGRAVKLRVISNHYSVADSQGRAVNAAAGHEIDVPVPAEGVAPPVTFRVASAR